MIVEVESTNVESTNVRSTDVVKSTDVVESTEVESTDVEFMDVVEFTDVIGSSGRTLNLLEHERFVVARVEPGGVARGRLMT